MDEDFILALQLQEQFNNEALESSDWAVVNPQPPLSIVDEKWEMLDPSPDVRAMFLQFNDMFFWGKLSGVEVKWSARMTLCAGVCSYEGRGGLCSIRLSEPLLKLRPRKDLVETLLHEMIHALLFVTQNNRDRDGHGPEFCKHMNRINKATGTNISIYHSFHDEVDVYRQHWWRCDGPCQNRKPFFGYVKRAMNRAPSARDPWWEDHRRTCGGTYTKIKEPENYGKKGKNEEKKEKNASKKPASKIIPASSTAGFVLGGNTQPPASIQKPPSQSSTQQLRTPEKPAKTPPTDTRPQPSSNHVEPCTVTALPKRSVSNTKAFININGSPVRITKDNSNLIRPKQRTVQDLFQSSTSITSSNSRHFGSGSHVSASTSSRPFGSPQKPGAAPAAGGRKRPREDRNSAHIFDFFQREVKQSSASVSSREQQEGSRADGGTAPSQSSSAVTVHCPVCQIKVLESQINVHLDSCLS
uniref:DNA-dependent metalloprotease SPRTN n=1 Tax=Astyanax mexicanus TaxID=7994 RepID=A0A8B9HS41_ASTMX